MNKEAQQMLNAILSKDLNSVTKEDIAFLKARRAYVPHDQFLKYVPIEAVKVPEVKEAKPMKYSEMLALAKAKGHKVRVGMRKDELMKLIG